MVGDQTVLYDILPLTTAVFSYAIGSRKLLATEQFFVGDQTVVYDILPSTTAVFSYAIGSRKLSANEQVYFVVGAQAVVSLLKTTQIISDVCFIITRHVAYASSEPKSFESRRTSFFSSLFFFFFFYLG